MNEQYYYMYDGAVKGPLALASIGAAVSAGKLAGDVMVSAGDSGLWARYADACAEAGMAEGSPKGVLRNAGVPLLEPFLWWTGRVLALLVVITYGVNLFLSMAGAEVGLGMMMHSFISTVLLVLSGLLMAVSRMVTYLRIISERA